MIPLSQLNTLSDTEYTEKLDSLYEYSPWVVEKSQPLRPFPSVKAMHATFEGIIYSATKAEQSALLLAHPDLAAKIDEIAELTDFSKSEQMRAGFAALPREDIEEFRKSLAAYRQKFGHPFILCVSEHDASEAIPILNVRLQSSPEAELISCLAQVTRIGWYRLQQTVSND